MEIHGIKGFRNIISRLKNFSSEEGIKLMLKTMGLHSQFAQLRYMRRLIVSSLGWASQFQNIDWQKNLDFPSFGRGCTTDFLAVRMAYDFGVFVYFNENPALGSSQRFKIKAWRDALETPTNITMQESLLIQCLYVCQLSLEIAYQQKLNSKLSHQLETTSTLHQPKPKAQLVFCIDVRSETIRRQIEGEDPALQTVGFAGFFGLPFDYRKFVENSPSHRLPVLLAPAYHLDEQMDEQTIFHSEINLNMTLAFMNVSAYFGKLRKMAPSSFLYVEILGVLYFQKLLAQSLPLIYGKFREFSMPHPFTSNGIGPNLKDLKSLEGTLIEPSTKMERAEAILHHMGLTGPFGNLIFLIGHGSATTNNAFGNSLDCGACGGHSGAEVHETITDEIFIFDPDQIPNHLRSEIKTISKTFKIASKKTRSERQSSRSTFVDGNVKRRSTNWSETRPEWGLAGNACFIVAPRMRTSKINLEGRSFLHDYDWRRDKDRNYRTLELIMTAPMVVTNWINMQYYASTTVPSVFGSGSKILHNLVNESGVVEGNGGDLKIGLPIQSVYDGENFVHQPLRLSVLIEAPQEEIEKILKNHEIVRELVEHEWIHLLQISPENLKLKQRQIGGVYREL